MKAIQTANKGENSRFSLKNNNYIKLLSNINRTGLFSAFTFILLALTCLFPISKGEQSTEAVTGTAQSSSLTLSVTGDTASVELDVNSTDGTFASSSAANSASFSVVTNNFSGYTLSISGSDNDGKLYDTTKKYFLEPLTSAVSEADFSSTSSLNGKWGYKPSKFNSAANTNYLPAPTTTASTLDTTSVANATANDYTISLGLRANYGTAANTYTNAFIITAVPNPIAYVITYDANTTDTVSNMPAAQNSTTSATEITLSDKTPAREGYDFKGWCTVVPAETAPDTCTGLTFQPGDTYGIDQTVENITTLYAMWKRSGIAITYDANGGYFGGNASKTTNTVVYDPNITTKAARMSDTYADSTDTITIPNASKLHIKVQYALSNENGTGTLEVIDGSGDIIDSLRNENDIVFGPCTYVYLEEKELIVSGNAIKLNYKKVPECVPGDDTICTGAWPIDCNCGECDYLGYGYSATIEGITILSGEELTPTRDGYAFGGWYTDAAGTSGNEFKVTAGMAPQTVYAKWRKYSTITFVSNTGGTVDKTAQTVLSETPITVNGNRIIVDGVTTTATASSGYSFNGWTNNCGSAMPANNCTITATWKEILPMQTYTAAQCQADASSQAVILKDTRDDQTYTARYINGNCWMTQNLAINKGQAMTSADTNIASNYTMPSTDLTTGDSYTIAKMAERGDVYGNYYNYCTATAGTVCNDSTMSEAKYDICPKGWKLPSNNEWKNIGGDGSLTKDNVALFTPVSTGSYYSGKLYGSGAGYGILWSSTAFDNSTRYTLHYSSGSGLEASYITGRYYGVSVRCVLK